MNPQEQVCHNPQCWVYGRAGEGHIVIHSQREQRYREEPGPPAPVRGWEP